MNATQHRPSRTSIRVLDQPPSPAEAAASVFALAGISPDDPKSFPIDLHAIASSLGLRVYMAEFEDENISGMLILDSHRVPNGVQPGESGTIFLKKGEFPFRGRFTLAHELGHVALGHRNGGVITDFFRGKTTGYTDPKERDANEFAAELLMPRPLFTDLWNSSASEEDLSLVFGVSVTAVAVRASALGLANRYGY